MVKQLSKIENLMQLNKSFIKFFSNKIVHVEEYKDAIAKGLPFLTEDEITSLKEKYIEGVTWEDINSILSKLLFRRDNFKKYLRLNLIDKQYKQKINSIGKTAVYPVDTVIQINFIQYYLKSSSKNLILFLQKTLDSFDASGIERLECLNDNVEFQHGNSTNIPLLKIKEQIYSEDIIDSDVRAILANDSLATEEYSQLDKELKDAYDKTWSIAQRIEDLLRGYKSIYIPGVPIQEHEVD